MTSTSNALESNDLEYVLEGLQEAAAACSDKLSVGDALDAFAERSFGALPTLVGLVAALPVIGAIPGMSILTGTLVILIAGQHLLGHRHIWAPRRLRDLAIDAETMEKGVEKAKPYAARSPSSATPAPSPRALYHASDEAFPVETVSFVNTDGTSLNWCLTPSELRSLKQQLDSADNKAAMTELLEFWRSEAVASQSDQ